MKKLIYLGLTGLLVLNFMSCSTNKRYDAELVPYQKKSGGEWGFIDTKGKVVIEPDFDMKPSPFSEGRAYVYKKDAFQFINKKGDLLDEEFVAVTMFSEGLACVVKEDQYPTYINKRMKTVLEVPYQKAGIFRNGLAKVCDKDGKWGFINKKGKLVIDAKYSKVTSFSEGKAVVYDEDSKCGVIDKKGNVVVEFADSVDYTPFSDGLSLYYDQRTDEQGYINKTGKIVIEGKEDYDYYPFVNGNATFQDDDGDFGLINKKGKVVLKAKYDVPLLFFGGMAVYEDDNEYGFINMKGKKEIKAKYDDIGLPFLDGKAIVKDGRRYRVINKKGDKEKTEKIYGLDRSIISNIYNKYYPAVFNYEQVVVSDYFDISLLMNDICVKDLSNINGVTTKSGLTKTLEAYGLTLDYVSYREDNSVTKEDALSSGSNYSISAQLNFYKNFKQPKSHYELKNYYDYQSGEDIKYYSVQSTDYEVSNNNVLESVIYTVTFKKEKTKEVIDSLVKRLVAAGYDKPSINISKSDKKKKDTDATGYVDDPYATLEPYTEDVQINDMGLTEVNLTKNNEMVGKLGYNVESQKIELTYYLEDKNAEVILSEDFENNALDSLMTSYYTSKFTVKPSVIASDAIEGKANYTFGKSDCSYSCYSVYTDLVIKFDKPVYVSTFEFKELMSKAAYSYNRPYMKLYIDGTKSNVNLAESGNSYSYSYSNSANEMKVQRIGVFDVVSEIVFAGNNFTDDDQYQIDDLVIMGNKNPDVTKKAATDSLFFGIDKLTMFTGNIGGKNINGRIVRNGHSLSGYYIYENSTSKIIVSGDVDDAAKKFYIYGVNDRGRRTDELKGSFKDGKSAEGTFKNLLNRRTSNFTLSAN